jgi:hypothetical protein
VTHTSGSSLTSSHDLPARTRPRSPLPRCHRARNGLRTAYKTPRCPPLYPFFPAGKPPSGYSIPDLKPHRPCHRSSPNSGAVEHLAPSLLFHSLSPSDAPSDTVGQTFFAANQRRQPQPKRPTPRDLQSPLPSLTGRR